MNWSFWIELLVRSAVLLLAGELLYRVSKSRTASFRHGLLVWVFVLLALLPVLSLSVPEIPISISRPIHEPKALVTVLELSSKTAIPSDRHSHNWLLWIWIAGASTVTLPLFIGSISMARITRQATPFSRRGHTEILISDELPVPVTFGCWRHRILLPSEARYWTSSRLQAVLAHELAHVRRRDVASQLVTHFITALWWFQPMAWVLQKRLRNESELACDAEAISSGFRPSDYASELLAIAKSVRRNSHLPHSAIAMVRSSDLEDRVRAVLNPPNALLRPPKTYVLGVFLGSVAIAASAVTITPTQTASFNPASFNTASFNPGDSIMKRTFLSALLTSASLSAATVSGITHDSSSAAIPDAKVTLLNPDTSARQEAVTDATGKFSFSGSGAGQYILRIEKPGFTSILREFDLKGDSKLDEEFTLVAAGEKPVADAPMTMNAPVNGEPPKTVRIGGGVAESNLITKVQPHYPAAAKTARIQGTVELQATISKDGVPLELRVISSPNDDLSQSSLEAVRQWRYRPTLLNGNPIQIVTTIVVNYTLAY